LSNTTGVVKGGVGDTAGEEMIRAYTILVGTAEEKGPSGVSRPGSKDNIKVDLQEIGWGTWIALI
jgi:hypothetical protein